MIALQVAGVSAGYGDSSVLEDVDLQVDEGAVVAVIGSNGAGKTTLLKTIMGLVRHSTGEIRLWNEVVPREKPWNRAKRGLAYVPEGARVFPDLTVMENLEIGSYLRRDRTEVAGHLDMVLGLFPALRDKLGRRAATLSGGQRQMLAIGRGLMTGARLLLLDEPSVGLAPLLVDEVFDTLQRINDDGTSLLLVEQNARKAFQIASRVYLVADGRVAKHGPVEAMREDPAVFQVYFGEAESS